MVQAHHGDRSGTVSAGYHTPNSTKHVSGRTSSRTRSTQQQHHATNSRQDSPIGASPQRSASRSRDRSNIRQREQPSPNISTRSRAQDSSEGEAVCNYDTSVTQLYELLESSSWEKARSRCRSHPHEVSTWIVRRDAISQKVRWKLLPLHAAVIFQSPNFVVSALIDQYPAAVSRRDDQGMLPLHLAFRYKEDSEDLLELLLTKYPKGALVKDKRERLPLEHGRGSKFSAKLMRLYADAHATMVESAAGHHHHKPNQESNHHQNVSEIKSDYEKKTRTLKSMYEERIKVVQDQNKSAMNQLRLATDEEKRKLINCHVEEMETMREMLNTHAGNEGAVISDLENEVGNLRIELSKAKSERDAADLHAADMKSYAEQLAMQMRQILHDQEALQRMVSQQQQELDKAHSRRVEMIQNLLQREEEERPPQIRGGSDIKQMIDFNLNSMKSMMSQKPARLEKNSVDGGLVGGRGVDMKPPHSPHRHGLHHPVSGQSHLHTSPHIHHTPIRTQNTSPHGYTGATASPGKHQNHHALPTGSTNNKAGAGGGSQDRQRTSYLTGSPVVKDDISAITDCSNF